MLSLLTAGARVACRPTIIWIFIPPEEETLCRLPRCPLSSVATVRLDPRPCLWFFYARSLVRFVEDRKTFNEMCRQKVFLFSNQARSINSIYDLTDEIPLELPENSFLDLFQALGRRT